MRRWLPFFVRLEIPAVWLTDDPGRYFPDRRFITRRDRQKSSTHFLWDVGLRGQDPLAFTLESSAVSLADNTGFWAADSGRYGINRVGSLSALNRLHANAAWDSQELLDRLYAEIPVENPALLGCPTDRSVTTGERSCVKEPRHRSIFEPTPASAPGGSAGWAHWARLISGYRFAFNICLASCGCCCDRTDRGTSVCALDLPILIWSLKAKKNGKIVRLASYPCPSGSGASLQATVELTGTRLSVTCGTNAMTFVQEGVECGWRT